MTEITGWAADPEVLAAFLDEPNLARIGTIDPSGEPHVVPVWYAWDGARFLVGTDAEDHKVHNVRRNGRASLEIDSDLRRKRGVLVRGAASLVEGEAGRALYTSASETQVRRYQPERPAAEAAVRMASRGTPVVIAIVPRSIVSWGR
jgi:PPOX class probable F420-dependent enzyme